MRFRLLVMCMVLMMAVVACDLAQPEPTLTPSRTPRPTITASYTVSPSDTPVITATLLVPTQTEIPLSATSVTSAASATAKLTTTAISSVTATASITPTRKATLPVLVVRPTIAPLEISNVLLIRIERDPVRENGAIVFLQVVYSGGKGPYRIFHDDTLLTENPFQVLTVCDGTIVHTLIVTSADGQSVTQGYYYEHMYCPP